MSPVAFHSLAILPTGTIKGVQYFSGSGSKLGSGDLRTYIVAGGDGGRSRRITLREP